MVQTRRSQCLLGKKSTVKIEDDDSKMEVDENVSPTPRNLRHQRRNPCTPPKQETKSIANRLRSRNYARSPESEKENRTPMKNPEKKSIKKPLRPNVSPEYELQKNRGYVTPTKKSPAKSPSKSPQTKRQLQTMQKLEGANLNNSLHGDGTLEDAINTLWSTDAPRIQHRDAEIEIIRRFCLNAINSRGDMRSLYLAGMPGTGKTSCVLEAIKTLEAKKFKFVNLNGGLMVKPDELYIHLYKQLIGNTQRISASAARTKLNFMFSIGEKGRLPIILLVDELDFLLNRTQSVIYDVFNWASIPESRVSVIAISNTFDLVQRRLNKRISSRMGTNHHHFQPYDHNQIIDILEDRLIACGAAVKKDAIGLAARKIAALSGDIRKAMDLLRRSFEVAIEGGESVMSMNHVIEALKESKETVRMCLARSFNFHQLNFFRAVYHTLEISGTNMSTFAHVYRLYQKYCSEKNIAPLDVFGAMELLNNGVSIGFYYVCKSTGTFNRKISLSFSTYEAAQCFKILTDERAE